MARGRDFRGGGLPRVTVDQAPVVGSQTDADIEILQGVEPDEIEVLRVLDIDAGLLVRNRVAVYGVELAGDIAPHAGRRDAGFLLGIDEDVVANG